MNDNFTADFEQIQIENWTSQRINMINRMYLTSNASIYGHSNLLSSLEYSSFFSFLFFLVLLSYSFKEHYMILHFYNRLTLLFTFLFFCCCLLFRQSIDVRTQTSVIVFDCIIFAITKYQRKFSMTG